ncbi:MAG: hypothetical protein WBG92_15995 [Thiohalocapsa sp.]
MLLSGGSPGFAAGSVPGFVDDISKAAAAGYAADASEANRDGSEGIGDGLVGGAAGAASTRVPALFRRSAWSLPAV